MQLQRRTWLNWAQESSMDSISFHCLWNFLASASGLKTFASLFYFCRFWWSVVAMSAMNLDPLASYVKQREGQRVIRKILISNNGMAAVKAEVGGNAFPGRKSRSWSRLTISDLFSFWHLYKKFCLKNYQSSKRDSKLLLFLQPESEAILSMRRWTFTEFGSEQLITFVAMATPDDLNANAEFIRLADSFVEVPGGWWWIWNDEWCGVDCAVWKFFMHVLFQGDDIPSIYSSIL